MDVASLRAAFARDPVLGLATLSNALGAAHGWASDTYNARTGKPRTVRVADITLDETRRLAQVVSLSLTGATIGQEGRHRRDLELADAALDVAIVQESRGLQWDEMFRATIAMMAAVGNATTAGLMVEALVEAGAEAPKLVLSTIASATGAVLTSAARIAGKTLREFGLAAGGAGLLLVVALVLWSQKKGRG